MTEHMCSICKKTAEWDDNWRWYGSVFDLDGETIKGVKPQPIVTMCSETCQEKAVLTGVVPADAEDLDD